VVIARDGEPVIALTPLPKPGALRVGLLGQAEESWNSNDALDEDDPRDWGDDEA
jgi:antitoxin (DNA-binding transcriptional repressor) of toxin-antitoxin stability system